MRNKRAARTKPLSIVVVLVATGEATPMTPALKARIIRGTCDLLEEHADGLDTPELSNACDTGDAPG